jgi:hypothetical protein
MRVLGAEPVLEDSEGALEARFGLVVASLHAVELSKVVLRNSNQRVSIIKRVIIDCESAEIVEFGHLIPLLCVM